MSESRRSKELQEILAESEDEDLRLLAETELFQVNSTTQNCRFRFSEYGTDYQFDEDTIRNTGETIHKEKASTAVDMSEAASQSSLETRSATAGESSGKCAKVIAEITVKRTGSELVSVTFTIEFAA